MLFVLTLISFMVTMVISPFSWFFDESFALVSTLVEMWLSWFQVFSWVSFCWYELVPCDEFLPKLSSLPSLIRSRLLVWHCWLICVVVVSTVVDESSWIGVLTLICGDDNCVIELLTLVLWLPSVDGSTLNRLLQAWWDDGDVEVGMLLIIPVRWLKMLPVVSLALFDKTVLRWDLKERKAKIKWEWKWNTNDSQLQLLISVDFYVFCFARHFVSEIETCSKWIVGERKRGEMRESALKQF